MSFAETLSRILEAPGALGAAFLDPSGEAVAQVGDEGALEILGAYQSVWLSELSRASERAGIGTLSDLSIEFDAHRVLSTEVKDGYFVLVVLESSGASGIARARVESVRESLAAEIG